MFEGLQMSLEHVVPESYIVLAPEEPKYELWMNFSNLFFMWNYQMASCVNQGHWFCHIHIQYLW